jgi:hypothetical protein
MNHFHGASPFPQHADLQAHRHHRGRSGSTTTNPISLRLASTPTTATSAQSSLTTVRLKDGVMALSCRYAPTPVRRGVVVDARPCDLIPISPEHQRPTVSTPRSHPAPVGAAYVSSSAASASSCRMRYWPPGSRTALSLPSATYLWTVRIDTRQCCATWATVRSSSGMARNYHVGIH